MSPSPDAGGASTLGKPPTRLGNLPSTIEVALQPSPESRIITEPNEPFRIVHVNEAWCRTCGYDAEEVLGQTCKFMHGPGTCSATLGMLKQALTLKRNLAIQLLNYSKSGRPFMNTLQVAPLYNKSGEVTHYLGVVLARFLDGGGPVPLAVQQTGVAASRPLPNISQPPLDKQAPYFPSLPRPALGHMAIDSLGSSFGASGLSTTPLGAKYGGSCCSAVCSVAATRNVADSGEYDFVMSDMDDSGSRVPPFLTKLTEILTVESPEVVALNHNTCTFTIMNPTRFAKEVRRERSLPLGCPP